MMHLLCRTFWVLKVLAPPQSSITISPSISTLLIPLRQPGKWPYIGTTSVSLRATASARRCRWASNRSIRPSLLTLSPPASPRGRRLSSWMWCLLYLHSSRKVSSFSALPILLLLPNHLYLASRTACRSRPSNPPPFPPPPRHHQRWTPCSSPRRRPTCTCATNKGCSSSTRASHIRSVLSPPFPYINSHMCNTSYFWI